MLRFMMLWLVLAAAQLQATERTLWWHNENNELNEAGQMLVELLLPDPTAMAGFSLAEREAWLSRKWYQVLADRARFAQYPLSPEQGKAGFEQAWRSGKLSLYLRRQQPDYPGYRQLKQHYHALEKIAGFTRLPPGGEVSPGERDRAIPALRRRLTELGYALTPPRGRADALDRSLSDILKGLQQTYGLEPNGRLTTDLRAMLNRSPAELRAELRHNLRRWLLLPPTAPEQFVLVNIPAYRLTLVNQSRPILSMKVIVGRPDWPTPELATHIRALKVNPDWTPTTNIIREDLLPAQRRDSGYLSRNGFGVWLPGGAGRQDPSSIDWQQPPVGMRLVQAPGPGNALGRFKFEMKNASNIYLHDTPNKKSFGAHERGLSHGCVRLAEPEQLVQSLGWSLPEYKQTRILPAHRKIPVFLVYFTTWVDEGGRLVTLPDIYNKNGMS